ALVLKIREVARLETLDVSLYKKIDFSPDPREQATAWASLVEWASYSVRPPRGRAIVFAVAHLGLDLRKLDTASLRVEGRRVEVVLPRVQTQVELRPAEVEVIGSNLSSAQTELRARMERQPLQFLARDLEGLLDEARGDLARFIGADPDDLAFVPNATSGVNTVIRSLELEPGDELLTTDHAYNACRNALRWQERRGAKVVVAAVPWPIAGPSQVIDAVLNAVTARTRLALLDHVTSPTAIIFPVEEIVGRLQASGIDSL